MFIRAVP